MRPRREHLGARPQDRCAGLTALRQARPKLRRDEHLAQINPGRHALRQHRNPIERAPSQERRRPLRQRVQRPPRLAVIIDQAHLEPRRAEPRRRRDARRPSPDHRDIRLEPPRRPRRERVRRHLPEPGHLLRHRLHHVRETRHPGHEMVMIQPVREEPVRHAQQIRLARPHHVLRLDALAAPRAPETRHHIRLAVDPRQAAVARAPKTARSPRPVELRAPRKRHDVRREQRHGQGLAPLRRDGLAVQVNGHRIPERPQTPEHAAHPSRRASHQGPPPRP
jgi:hypothetical protein